MRLTTRLLTTLLLVLLGWQLLTPLATHAHEPSDAAPGYSGAMQRTDGTVDLRARSYQPDLGRFLQRDPFPGVLARPQALNRAAYVEGNPLAFTDPSGFVRAPHGAFDWPAPAPPSYPQQTRLTAPRGSLAEALAQNYQAQRAWDCLSLERKISLTILQGMGLVSQIGAIAAPMARTIRLGRTRPGRSPDLFRDLSDDEARLIVGRGLTPPQRPGYTGPPQGYRNIYPPKGVSRTSEPIGEAMRAGRLTPGAYIYVIDDAGVVRVAPISGTASDPHHQEIAHERNVYGAGELTVAPNGTLTFDDASGHYIPDISEFGPYLRERLTADGIDPTRVQTQSW